MANALLRAGSNELWRTLANSGAEALDGGHVARHSGVGNGHCARLIGIRGRHSSSFELSGISQAGEIYLN
jgi:hypothetical protein